MQPVLLDPELLAVAFIDRHDPARRLLGLLAFGRWCQYIELFGAAEEAKLEEEANQYAGFRSGPSAVDLLQDAQDHKALCADRLPVSTPEEFVLTSSRRIQSEASNRVEEARKWVPSLRSEPEAAAIARRLIVGHTAVLLDEPDPDVPLPPYTEEPSFDFLVEAALRGLAVLVTERDEIVPGEETMVGYRNEKTGDEIEAWRFESFIEKEINRYPFDLAEIPGDLLVLASRGFN